MHWLVQRALISGVLTVLMSALIAAGPVSASEEQGLEAEDELIFSMRFWPDEIELSGKIHDQRTAEALVAEVRRAKPDSEIWDVDLDVDGRARPLPPMDELSGLLMELALSTKEGRLRIAADSITVSGLTDSLVTHAAFDTRLRELAAGRFVHSQNEIRVIPAKDLKLRIGRRPKLALEPQPLEYRPFEVSDEPYGPADVVLRALPIDLAEGSIAIEEEIGNESLPDSAPAIDFSELEISLGPLAPIRFEANTFLVEFKQHDIVREAAELISALPQAMGKVTLRGYPDATGQGTYHQWLALARAKQVRQLLVNFGVPEDRLTVEGSTVGSRRLVEIVIPRR